MRNRPEGVATQRPMRHLQFVGAIPAHWRDAAIGEVFELQLGKMLSQKSKTGIGYRPYLGNSNVKWGTFELSKVEEMDFDDAEFEKFLLHPGDILVCEGGEVGRTAIWKGELNNCCYQKALHRLRPSNNDVIPEFFQFYMELAASQSLFVRYTNESSIAHLSQETLTKVRIPVPPRREQARIVAILSALAEAIEATRAVTDQTRQLKTAFLQDLFSNGLPGHHSIFTAHAKTGQVPSDWKPKTLDELVCGDRPICYGILMPGRGHANGVPVIKVKDIRDGRVDESELLLTSPEMDEEFRRSRLRAGDLLITIRGTTGRVAIVPDSLDSANITQDTARVSIADEVTRDFVYYSLQTRQLQDQVSQHTIGQAVKGINIEEVRKLTLAIPSRRECEQIVGMFHSLESRLNIESDYLNELSTLKHALSQGLLTGRIPVDGVANG